MSDHDRLREMLGAYVLGALSPDERAELDEHLPTCARCRDELVALAPLPGLLAQVGEEDLEPGTSPAPDEVVTRARSQLHRLRTSRRRWRLAAGAAAVVAILALGVALVDGGGSSPTQGQDTVALVIDSAPTVDGSVEADRRAWGTYVYVSLEGLPSRELYRIWAVDHTGEWHEAGSWLPTTDASARLGASTHLHLDQIARVVVTSADRTDRLVEATPG